MVAHSRYVIIIFLHNLDNNRVNRPGRVVTMFTLYIHNEFKASGQEKQLQKGVLTF